MNNLTRPLRSCSFPGCLREFTAKGLCRTHYIQQRRTGRVFEINPRGDEARCALNGCSRGADSKSLCRRHYGLARRYTLSLERLAEIEAVSECGICGKDRDERFSIDHDHACCPTYPSCGGCVRGVLCDSCNLALNGRFDGGWLKRADEYLSSSRLARVAI